MSLNDFEENILNNFISNIKLFNNKQHKTETEIKRLRKVIKEDSLKLERKYGITMILNQVQLNLDNSSLYKLVFGLDLHTQLVIQGLGDYIEHFRNITLDPVDKCIRDEFGGVFLNFNDYIPVEFIEVEDLKMTIRSNSIITKEIDGKIFTVYIVMSKILYITVNTKPLEKVKKKPAVKTAKEREKK